MTASSFDLTDVLCKFLLLVDLNLSVQVAKEFGVPVPFQRYWLWARRKNHTYRLDQPLTHLERAQPVGQLGSVSRKAHNAAELNLFLEVELGLDLRPVAPPEKTEDDILLFFKLYDPEEEEELRYVGRLFVKSSGKPSEILTRLNEMAGYDPDEEIALYEEIKFEPNVMCEPIDKNVTFRISQLGDGDIVCFQKVSVDDIDYPDVPSFLKYVARDEDLFWQIGANIYFDLVDHDRVRSFRVSRRTPFYLFKVQVAKEFGVPVPFQRYWLWARRKNHTYRLDQPLTHLERAQPVGQLGSVSRKAHNAAELNLFLEVELGLDLRPVAPPEKTEDDILLFFKLYDPEEEEELRYVGRLFVKSSGKPSEILTRLNEMAGYDPDEEIALYEEIKFEPNVMCEPIDKNVTFRISQLGDGDIVCFQKVSVDDIDYPDVPSFLKYVLSVGF
ncbi:ubiquitin carboxyl-terminal hydrolase 7 [Vigna unguiculata]|uniref:Ubiquitin carboxyl-terminal hydrolase 7 n=1 Tax=Vigna unguiculata TaxID=3917 RepID=A0A4D6MJ34_VIGUN|nr:ubiquitin carboxyl-terminal hydrolase 7 [Vigna unguiculata]